MLTSKERSETKRWRMMPIRDVVIFPCMMTPFVVGRESSVRALEEAMTGDKKIFLATQHDASIDEPKPNEIFSVGCIVNIVQSLKLPDGNIKVLVEGVERAKVVSVSDDEGFFRAIVRTFNYKIETGPQLDALVSRVTTLFEQYVKLSQNLNYETMIAAIRVDDAGKLADTVGANLQLTIEEKQELLEIFDPIDRLTRVAEMLDIEIEKLNVDRTIQGRVKRQMEKAQKEYYLNEKIKAIQKELGRGEKSEIDELKKRIETAGMTLDAQEKATGRKFVRMSLGGVRDEAEIRGHRRTYIGALPGQVIQMMKKSGTRNPVFMLDEVDKMSMDFRGDPSAALLEVLDPEQNFMFVDHYLDVEYDLSQVFFVATANVMHTIPAALQDRMEVLRLHGYTENEKVEIAKQFLVKKQREATGLTEKQLQFTDDALR